MPTNADMPKMANDLVRSNGAALLPAEYSVGFDQYLNLLPWAGSGIDWERMPPSVDMDRSVTSETDFLRWLELTAIGQRSHICVWYSLEAGGIIMPIDKLSLETMDALYWGRPGFRYLFGVDVIDGEVRPFYRDLIQYTNTGDTFSAAARRSQE